MWSQVRYLLDITVCSKQKCLGLNEINFFSVDEEFRRNQYADKVFCKLGGIWHPQGITETKRHHKSYYQIKREYNLQNYLGDEIWDNSKSCVLEYRGHHVELKVQSFETAYLLCPSAGLFRYFLDGHISVQAVDLTRLALI